MEQKDSKDSARISFDTGIGDHVVSDKRIGRETNCRTTLTGIQKRKKKMRKKPEKPTVAKSVYKTAAYLRLSKGDGDVDGIEKSESNSISNQRLIIDMFLEKHPEMELVDTYIDDGFTGTNFKRPELKRLMYDVDDGRIDCIVCKDLSRWGRERIETGTYLSRIFKEKGVRFVAINDHYDSLTATGSDDHLIMPIKALTNDTFSRDISMKVRSSQSVKREKGEYIAPFAPYGYKKDPENKNHLIVDEPAAQTVRRIFARKIEGVSANAIARELTEEGILPPAAYKRRNGQKCGGFGKTRGTRWNASQVLHILRSEIYIGNMVQGKTSKVSYKVNRIINKPKEDWDIVEGTHEAIISRSDFLIVQSLLNRDTISSPNKTESYLFSGLLFCGDCGSAMNRRTSTWKEKQTVYYICSTYNNKSRGSPGCSRHSIRESDLIQIVRESLNRMIRKMCRFDELAKRLEDMQISMEDAFARDQEIQRLQQDLEKCRVLKSSLYQDLKEGLISGQQFYSYREQYSERERRYQESILRQKDLIRGIYENGIVAGDFLNRFREHPQIEELNHRLLVSLIDRILIYEDKTVDIVYRYTDEMQKCASILNNAS